MLPLEAWFGSAFMRFVGIAGFAVFLRLGGVWNVLMIELGVFSWLFDTWLSRVLRGRAVVRKLCCTLMFIYVYLCLFMFIKRKQGVDKMYRYGNLYYYLCCL